MILSAENLNTILSDEKLSSIISKLEKEYQLDFVNKFETVDVVRVKKMYFIN